MYEELQIKAMYPESTIEKIEERLKKAGFVNIVVKKKPKKRTMTQNRGLHLYYTKYANALNEAGFDVRKTISKNINLPWTPESVKEYIWRPLQEHSFGTRSTAKLKTNQIDKVIDLINSTIGERTGVSVAFPSREEQYYSKL